MDALVPAAARASEFFGSGERLEHWGTAHLTMLIATGVGAALLVWWGRRVTAAQGMRISRVLAVVLLVLTVVFQVYWLLPGRFVLEQSLPLQLSDVLRLVAAYALWTHRPWAVAVTVYWGLTLNLQPMLTPDVNPDPGFAVIEFASFWAPHMLMMWAPIFLLWGIGKRLTWRGYTVTLAITCTWAAVVFGLNVLMGTNYGYLNAKPPGASLLDLFGPWPFYLLVELAAVCLVWALLTAGLRERSARRSRPIDHRSRPA